MQEVIALVRVSDEEQAIEGLGGITRQWRDIDAVCARENLTIKSRFQLEGASGSTVKLHPQFRKMLQDVAAPGIVGLVISSPDRLMRCDDLADLAILSPFGVEGRTRLIFTAESVYNLRKLDSQLMFLFRTLMGGHEKRQIIDRTSAGKNLSRERGDKCGDKPPNGVEFVITDPKAHTGFYRFTPESERIKKALYRVLDRDTSILAISRELGFKHYQTMRKQLSNPIWLGIRESTMKREKLPPGPNGELRYKKVPRLIPIRTKINLQGPPLVPQSVFDEVQSVLAGINKEHVSKRSGSSKFELSGLLRCPCGERMYSRHDERGGKSGYYICRSGYLRSTNGCGHDHLNRAKTDEAVVDLLGTQLSNSKLRTRLITAAMTPANQPDLRAERDKLRFKIESLTVKRTKLVDKLAEGFLTDEEARVSLAKLRSEIESVSARLCETESHLKIAPVSNLPTIVNSIVRFFTSIKLKPTEQRKRLIRTLVHDVQIADDKSVSVLHLKLGEGRTVALDLSNLG